MSDRIFVWETAFLYEIAVFALVGVASGRRILWINNKEQQQRRHDEQTGDFLSNPSAVRRSIMQWRLEHNEKQSHFSSSFRLFGGQVAV